MRLIIMLVLVIRRVRSSLFQFWLWIAIQLLMVLSIAYLIVDHVVEHTAGLVFDIGRVFLPHLWNYFDRMTRNVTPLKRSPRRSCKRGSSRKFHTRGYRNGDRHRSARVGTKGQRPTMDKMVKLACKLSTIEYPRTNLCLPVPEQSERLEPPPEPPPIVDPLSITSETDLGPPCIIASSLAFPTSTLRDNHCSLDTDSFPLLVDSGASYCITHCRDDFISPLIPTNTPVKGIIGKSIARWKGTVKWSVADDEGVSHDFIIPNTYFVQESPIRLLSPQHLSQVHMESGIDTMERCQGTRSITCGTEIVLEWADQRKRRTMDLCRSNTGILHSSAGYDNYAAFAQCIDEEDIVCFDANLIPDDDDESSDHNFLKPMLKKDVSTTTPTESNAPPGDSPILIDFHDHELELPSTDAPVLDKAEHELLFWHYRLGHESFDRLQQLAKLNYIPPRLANCRKPQCAACHYGKATRRPWRSRGENSQRVFVSTEPGQVVSVDQLKSPVPGLIGQIKGWLTKKRYIFATVFVDHYSSLSYVHFQKTDSAEETVEAKRAFEGYARQMGVNIRHYHADNGRFADNLFRADAADKRQTISYCGVNAHFQNGIAERRIRELQDGTRTELIHAKHRWPTAIEVNLWPFAMRYRNEVFNSTPRKDKERSPLEIFSSSQVQPKLKHFHTFGCPAYRVKQEIQAGNYHPKWEERAKPTVYLGTSPRHARSVALVLDLETAHVSPQFHLKFDDLFETVSPNRTNPAARISKWQSLCHFMPKKENESTNLKPRTSTSTEINAPTLPRNDASLLPNNNHGIPMEFSNEQPPLVEVQPDQLTVVEENQNEVSDVLDEPPSEESQFIHNEMDGEPTADVIQNQHIRRSSREHRPTQRYLEGKQQEKEGIVSFAVDFETIHPAQYVEDAELTELESDPISFAFKANKSDPDTMYLHEAMREPDAQQFREAMRKELKDHTERKHWKLRKRSEVPEGVKILPAVWAMKRKRKIATREVYKWKARLNLGGHKQEYGVHYWETYSPVVRWTSIRLLMVLALINGWSTRQIDFVLAYPQARISTDNVFLEIPKDFDPSDMPLPEGVDRTEFNPDEYCLHVTQNIYGGRDSGRQWAQHLKQGLEKLGFKPLTVDECVYVRGTTIFSVFVDDGILYDKDPAKIDQAIADMQSIFTLEDQGEVDDYLGVKVEKNVENKSFTLSQPHLIDSILKDLGLIDEQGNCIPGTKTADTPAVPNRKLWHDPNDKPFDYNWDMRSVIGKLNFLEKSTRGDLGYSVHQCARFMSKPTRMHGEAVKRIGRYLLGTRNKGFIFKPDEELSFECYVDADYCGNWNSKVIDEDPSSAKSRTGYIITYAGCPIVWASRLQSVFALSTCEAEFIALSTSLRDVIGLMHLLEELKESGFDVHSKPTVRCKLFEDNTGALEMARVAKYRPRTRHLNASWHHFRSHVARELIKILPIRSWFQRGDLLTKQGPLDDFIRLRRANFGW